MRNHGKRGKRGTDMYRERKLGREGKRMRERNGRE